MNKQIIKVLIFIFSPLIFSQTPPENYTREWGTYFNISYTSLDDDGNLWLATTINEDFVTTSDTLITANAHQSIYGGESDIFIVKFSPDGDLLYASYYGGEEGEYVSAIDAKDGKVYIVGTTTSEEGITTSGSYQEELEENFDPNGNSYDYQSAFLAQFDDMGQLQWSTYYQGDRTSNIQNVAVGESNDVFIWGITKSSDLGTVGAFKETIPPPYMDDSGLLVAPYYPILARFNDVGQLQWATYYGPDIIDENTDYNITALGGLAVDFLNNIYLGGSTNDTVGYYGTPGAHQVMSAGGLQDIFFSKFSPTGQRLWSTYYGGEESEGVPYIHIGRDDSFYLSGRTNSETGIATSGTYQDILTADGSAFLVKFSLNGQRLWGTYLNSGALVSLAHPIVVDEDGYVFLGGSTNVNTDISTEGSWQEEYGGGNNDLFIVKFNSTGSDVLWGTYYGGMGLENATKGSLLLSEDNEFYITGSTSSFSNIASEGSLYDDSISGVSSFGGFLTKFIPCPEPEEPIAENPQAFQSNQGETLDNLEVEISDWEGSEPIITWYADADGEEELPETTELEDGETYYVSQRIQGCDESALVEITVQACEQPEPPTGNSPQGFDTDDTLEDLNVEGENLTWYADADREEQLPADTELEDGTTYYVSQTVGGCESELLVITVDEDLAVSTANFTKIRLSPNPNNGDFHLTGLPSEEVKLRIYDIHGRILYTETLKENTENHQISPSNQLSTGIYFVQLASFQQNQNFKMVVE